MMGVVLFKVLFYLGVPAGLIFLLAMLVVAISSVATKKKSRRSVYTYLEENWPGLLSLTVSLGFSYYYNFIKNPSEYLIVQIFLTAMWTSLGAFVLLSISFLFCCSFMRIQNKIGKALVLLIYMCLLAAGFFWVVLN